MKETAEARQQRILELLEQQSAIKVANLSAILGVSSVTARRDLAALEQQGQISRHHGGVSASNTPGSDRAGKATLGTVALIAPERHPYLSQIMQSARAELEKASYKAVLILAPQAHGSEQTILNQLVHDNLAGVLLAPRWSSQQDEEGARDMLASLALPTVLVERHASRYGAHAHVDSVSSDHMFGAQLAIDHLASSGHSRILLAARNDSPSARLIAEGFAFAAASDSRITKWARILSSPDADPGASNFYYPWDTSKNSAEVQVYPNYTDNRWLLRVLKEGQFTALATHSDENALVLVHQLTAAGLQVPEDIAIVAYDDVVAEYGEVPLTAVAPPKSEVGRMAARILLARLRSQSRGERWVTRRVELLPHLVTRSSS